MKTVIIGMFLLLCLATFKLIVEEKKSKTKDEIIALLNHQNETLRDGIKWRDAAIDTIDSTLNVSIGQSCTLLSMCVELKDSLYECKKQSDQNWKWFYLPDVNDTIIEKPCTQSE